MLARKHKQLITYESITIYEKTYRFPIFKNPKLKKVQKKIIKCQELIQVGGKSNCYFWGIVKRKQEVTQEKVFAEVKLLISEYIQIIDSLDNYKDSYQSFLLKFIDDWKNLFNQKYIEIRKINDERNKLEIKHNGNTQIIEKLTREKQENLKSILLLSKTNLLILEKIELLSEGIKQLAEDTQNQRQAIEQIVKDLDVYQEVYEYQIRATKIRQEIAKIAETAMNVENSLKDCFNPFQSLIDEVVKIDADFYATVGEIQHLATNDLNYQPNVFTIQDNHTVSHNLLNLLVASYEKQDRLNEAFFKSQLLDWQLQDSDFSQDDITANQAICLISNYMSTQLVAQKKVLGIVETDVVYSHAKIASEATVATEPDNHDIDYLSEFKSNKNIDYSILQNLLAQYKWQDADIETAKLMLRVMGKNYWHEVYKADILAFSCQELYKIDQLWQQYSHGYFGFSVQQSIWEEIGGQIDYETEKKLGDRLGWRKEGNWLNYEQITFKLSPNTPIGHLPVKWLHYDGDIFDICPNSSAEPMSMGAWRVGSWLVWQMHLFFTRVKICRENFPII
ncbi:GUN4-like protein [Trichormus variabilis ATCC 29413]|uniref:GUN4-like protein n=5 Tax=Anabaena variabilis TaxID=264691 RepID=Q3MCP0_TRIV2|nr:MULTISPECIES: GUN4 domain-containing protein [Nostocaceae]ABA21246.1 GUN4-like protein [Trichormus variabilis ATCC 29413]MBC1214587.1 GUN4 domain-containing protein [Trichormus variabilis ARAD]MBC1301072.1 GUN4 domain-containing protein [Trichormus variabilis N2B]MBC1312629.1 GUN4 domain-containing protein [Trichormus variabilis PNB]MBD2381933.1 GUN4 domain-containing protein [Trichormus variabilis FACHB-319]